MVWLGLNVIEDVINTLSLDAFLAALRSKPNAKAQVKPSAKRKSA